MTFLAECLDSPGVSFTWSQGMSDMFVHCMLFLHDLPRDGSLQSRDFSVRMMGDDAAAPINLTVEYKNTRLVTWPLFRAVRPNEDGSKVVEGWELLQEGGEVARIAITLEKQERELWQSFRRQAVWAAKEDADGKLFCTEDELQEFIELELPQLDGFDPSKPKDEQQKKVEPAAAADAGDKKDGDAAAAAPAAAATAPPADDFDLDAVYEESMGLKPSVTTVVEEYQKETESNNAAAAAAAAGSNGAKSGLLLEDDHGDADELAMEAHIAKTRHISAGTILAAKRDEEARRFREEYEALSNVEAKYLERVAEKPEDNTKESQRMLEQLRVLKGLLQEKVTVRAQHPSLRNLITVIQIEMRQFLTGNAMTDDAPPPGSNAGTNFAATAGFDDIETEEYRDEGEKGLSEGQLIAQAKECLEVRTEEAIDDGVHFLRLAALKKNSAVAAMMLHSLYTNLKAPTHGAYFVLRRALHKDEEQHTNRRCGELVAAGAHPFVPSFALAVFFLSRAAKKGDVQALLSLSHLFFEGTCRSHRAMLHADVVKRFRSLERGSKFLQLALDRGCPDAYFAKAGMHLDGERGHAKDRDLAMKYFALLKQTDAQLAQRVGKMFELAFRHGGTDAAVAAAQQSKQGGAAAPSATPSTSSSTPTAGSSPTARKAPPSPTGPSLPPPSKAPSGLHLGGRASSTASGGQLTSVAPRIGSAGSSALARPVPTAAGAAAASGSPSSSAGGAASSRLQPAARGTTSDAGSAGGRSSATGAGAGRRSRDLDPWQSRFEFGAKTFAAGYALYSLAFPVRLMLLPYFYEFVDMWLGRLFGMGSGAGRRRSVAPGGMLM